MNKRNFLRSAALLAVASLNFVSCGDEASVFDPTSVKSDLSVIAKDYSGGQVLTGATFTLLSGEEVVATNATGAFTQIPAGSYSLKVEKTDYATYLTIVSIGVSNGAYTTHAAQNVELFKLGAKLSGKATYSETTSAGSQTLPVAGAILTLSVDNPYFAVKEYTATVGADGAYVFDNLPEKLYATINSVVTIDGVVYQGSETTTLKAAGQEGKINISFTRATDQLLPTSTPTKVEPLGDIVFTFNQSMDVARIARIYVYNGNDGTTILVDAVWSDDDKTLTVKNAAAGQAWPAGANLQVRVDNSYGNSNYLYSLVSGQVNMNNYPVSVNVVPVAAIANFVGRFASSNYYTDHDTLYWDTPTDSVTTNYRLYRKAESAKVFTQASLSLPIAQVNSSGSYSYSYYDEISSGGRPYTFGRTVKDGKSVRYLTLNPVFTAANTKYEYKIEAYNGVLSSKLSATVVTIEKPKVAAITGFEVTKTLDSGNDYYVELKLNATDNGTQYRIYRKPGGAPDGSYSQVANIYSYNNGNNFYDDYNNDYDATKSAGVITISYRYGSIPLDAAGYDYKVEAWNASNGSEYSKSAAVTGTAKL